MAEISSLLKTLQLDETLPGVKSALNNFLALSNADKASRRLREAKKIFPLIFGDDAVSESDVSYSERNKTTW